MSNNEEGVKMVRMAAAQIESLCPQVINAARLLAARPRSKVALDNMDVFKDTWEKHVRLLTEAVDDITTIDDFLAVSGLDDLLVLPTRSLLLGKYSTLKLVSFHSDFSVQLIFPMHPFRDTVNVVPHGNNCC